ncbi:MAG: hypothetical protein FWD34_04770 [Oscillospiraceae bacterium]|nr:hypothetical protein [Oscillospiraceae bacterium]
MIKRKRIIISIIACVIILPPLIIFTWFKTVLWLENREVVGLFNNSTYYQSNQKTFEEFTTGMNQYTMKLTLADTIIELRLKREDDNWNGTLSHSIYGQSEQATESYDVEIVSEHLIIHCEPQRQIPLTDFFFSRFDSDDFKTIRVSYGLFNSTVFEIDGVYDIQKTREFMEIFERNFISVFSSVDDEFLSRYNQNIHEFYAVSFGGAVVGNPQIGILLHFNSESDVRAHYIGYGAEMVFAERVYK